MGLFATISNGRWVCGRVIPLRKAGLSRHASWSVSQRKGFAVTGPLMSSGFKPFAMEAKPPDGLVLSGGHAEQWAFTSGGGGGER